MNKQNAKDTIEQLVERFSYRIEEYKKGNYNETQTRNDFINPFFESLGWDINNKLGQSEAHRDVIHEDKIKIGGKTKAPDYCFTNLGSKQFFLEAKKPIIDLKEQISPAYQLRRYGWSAKLPISILTDFEEFAIYDCSIKPLPTDKPVISRIKYLEFSQYVREFDFLWETFSKEMVMKGSIDKYFGINKGKKVTSGVDAEFLKSLDSWRDLLARDIVVRNSQINEDELNYSLQKIMDRIIFLRICEDRGVEKEEQLFNLIGKDIYKNIKNIFHQADQKYNSGLFDYKKDLITDNLNIDDKVLKTIIEEMYYPKSPYEFSVIPVEILGHSYEQYLGKVIKIDTQHNISIEEKPEVRKAGGVYYTPQYIVDYIVKNTVGKLIGDIGNGNQEVGNNKYSINEDVENGKSKSKELQGTFSLEGSSGTYTDDLQDNKGITKTGSLQSNESDSKSSSINSGKYSRGMGTDVEGGIKEISENFERFGDGTGNSFDYSSETGIHKQRNNDTGLETASNSPENARRNDKGIKYENQTKKSKIESTSKTIPNSHFQIPNSLTPEDVAKIKICDPACGSGSFLLGAYQYLLDWHLNYYMNADIKRKDKFINPYGNLTTQLKKSILLNNIFGVDIDTNAVEVTKLSLMLKAMEGETDATISSQMTLLHERVLPTLDNNIKSGNSLIDTDFYDNQIDFEPGAEKKIKPFNWEHAFPEVFKQGGFDVVIGNPPWVDIKGHDSNLVKYYFIKFYSTENRINLYSIFIERSLELLNQNGIFSFIIPNSLLYQSSYTKMRQLILNNNNINEIIRLPDNTFENVKAETIIINISKVKNQNSTKCLLYARNSIINVIDNTNPEKILFFNQEKWINNNFSAFNIFSNELIDNVINKIEKNTIALESICDFTLGLTPYDKYKGHSEKTIKERKFHSTTKIDDTFKELLEGSDVQRYNVCWGKKEYIKYGNWLGAPRKKEFFTEPRILIRQIVSGNPLRIYAGYTEQELYNTQTIFNLIIKSHNKFSLKVILGIINSKLMNFYHTNKYLDVSKNLFQKILIQNCKMFPIPQNPDPSTQTQLIKLVDTMLQLNKDLQEATLPEQKEQLQSRIIYTDKKIDQLVYQLYELTEDEIKVVEGE